MPLRIGLFLFLLWESVLGQHTLDDFIARATENSPSLKEYRLQQSLNQLQGKINTAENNAFHVSLTGDYLFTPYFNNQGRLVTTNPSPQAVGYDIGLFNGGLYSAQINLQRPVFNGGLMNALDGQIRIQDENARYGFELEKHSLVKQVTDQYLNTYRALLMVHLADEMASNLSDQLALTAGLLEKGFATSRDYLQLKIECKTQMIALGEARRLYRSSLYQLCALCGIQDTTVVGIDSVKLQIGELCAASNFLQKYSLDSLITQNQQQLFETQYQPKIGLFVNGGLNAVQLADLQRKFGMSAGLSLAVPLYDGRQKSLSRQQNLVHQNTIRAYRLYCEQTVRLQRQDILSRIGSFRQNLRDLSEQIADGQRLLQVCDAQLRQGNLSMMDHLNTIRNFIEIRKNAINAEIDYQLEISAFNYWNW